MKYYLKYIALALIWLQLPAKAQVLNKKQSFTKADSLRGSLTPLRTCYDVNYYHLDVQIDIDKRHLKGSNLFKFTATQDFNKLQIDLFENLRIEKVLYADTELPFERQFGAVFIEFPKTIKKGSKEEFTVYYSGYPTVAKNAPWDGGFVFSKDKSGKPWVGVACQGFGASSWWPTKDHQSDEPDSMMISVSVPEGLMNVSNGRLRSAEKLPDGYIKYNWFVSYPINNYSVTVNIADYATFSDKYKGVNGDLSLDYFVLKESLAVARKQFQSNVKPMLSCFEEWFGPYPFYKDGFKMVETPYLGMEHQSAVAYGNGYRNGYKGTDLSGTGLGLSWDYIIIHESGHEWFGNNVTAADIADMWIHEAFTMYSEAIFIECQKGQEAASRYIEGIRKIIGNEAPIIGPYGVNREGSADMYSKGANLIQTLRAVINDDDKFKSILFGLNKDLGLKTIATEDIINYFNKKTGKNLRKIFDQYLRYTGVPTLEIKKQNNLIAYRWNSEVADFDMPIRVKISGSKDWKFLYPTTKWQSIKASGVTADTTNFYIQTKNL